MPADRLHREVARVALRAAARYGFALGGGNALIAHGVISRPTADVDLFTNRERGVREAAGVVEAALRAAGYRAQSQDKAGWLSEVFDGMGDGLAEWIVTAPGGRQMALQMAYFERAGRPVIMEFGPVLDLEDALGGKVAALATRVAETDYADVAHALRYYSAIELIGFARRLDPGLTRHDFTDAMRRLDQLSDRRFTAAGISHKDITLIRRRFANWPRS